VLTKTSFLDGWVSQHCWILFTWIGRCNHLEVWEQRGSVSSLYAIVNFRGIVPVRIPSVWKIAVPPRLHVFLWLLAKINCWPGTISAKDRTYLTKLAYFVISLNHADICSLNVLSQKSYGINYLPWQVLLIMMICCLFLGFGSVKKHILFRKNYSHVWSLWKLRMTCALPDWASMICRCCFGRWPTTLGQWKILEEKKEEV
jgi:hypothetical protein